MEQHTMKSSEISFPRMIAMAIIAAAILALLFVPGCASTSDYGPEEAADKISAHLVEGETGDADSVYDDVSDSESHRDTVYNALYANAREHFESENYSAAIALLQFLNRHYEDAMAPKEALLYAHLLSRSNTSKKLTGAQLKEMKGLIDTLRKKEKNPPPWVDLASAQMAIDAGNLGKARTALTQFISRWDRQPPSLRGYVVELERYLKTHGG